MPLTATADLIRDAVAERRGIGAFNVIHLETAQALAAAAEAAQRGIILQISENCVSYHGGLAPIALGTLAIARASDAPIAVHLDHAEDPQLAQAAVDLGFGSVMYDGSGLDYANNVDETARIVEYAHARGAIVEAELGAIGGKDGAHAPGVRTDPTEARSFVEETGVDALAVAVGSSHAMTRRVASVDLELIARIHQALAVPLVLHGSSGVPDDQLVAAITAGMTKINVSTHLNGVFTKAITDYLAENPAVVDSRRYVAAGRTALTEEATRLITMFALAAPPGTA
ncbi:MAG: class II fructose-bisphosphate aldolase [Microbacteriaceae bacterium]